MIATRKNRIPRKRFNLNITIHGTRMKIFEIWLNKYGPLQGEMKAIVKSVIS